MSPANRHSISNINPATGLASDYLNHFNEAIMLLDMLPQCPDCIEDFLQWRPKSYRDHFSASGLRGQHDVIAAYDAAEPVARQRLEMLADTMTAVLTATGAALRSDLPPATTTRLAALAAAWLKPLVARAGAVINGEQVYNDDANSLPQATVDRLMAR